MNPTEAAAFSSLSESAAAQESPFVGYFNSLSPIDLPDLGFSELGAPSHDFTSPHITSHHQTQFLSIEISQNENKTRVIIEDTKSSTSLLHGMFITDKEKDFDGKNDARNQNCDVLFSQHANELQGGYDFTRHSLPPLQALQEREYCLQMERGIHASAENKMLLDDHEAGLQQRGMLGHYIQFDDATLNALASSNSSPLTPLITEQRHENNALIAAGSVLSESPKPLNMFKPVDLPATVYDWRKSSSKDANQSSTGKKKTSDGGKRCNCRKSRCLKLYCECFSSQYFCGESTCTCRDCGNTPENEEEITDVKEEIESRKPLAFAPNVVESGTDVPCNDINTKDVNLKIPSASRHKSGCNCQKSKCQKKYCQCYEANVGCTSACRCQGCNNIHGSKGEYEAMIDAERMKQFRSTIENTSDIIYQNKLEMVANTTNLLHSGSYGPNQPSLLTPPLQCSYQGTEAAANSPLVSASHLLPSPSPNATAYTPQLTNEMVAASYNWQLDYNNVNQSSPRCNSLNNTCQLTPHSNPQSLAQASLFPNHPQSELSHGNSLHWNSPISSMTISGQLPGHESDSRLLDTPVVPNQMQVCPPQSQTVNFMSNAPPSLPPGTSSSPNSECSTNK